MTSLLQSVAQSLRSASKQLLHGDVYVLWRGVLRLLFLAYEDEHQNRTRFLVLNVLLCVWLLTSGLRLGAFVLVPPEWALLLGNTFTHIMSHGKVAGVSAALILFANLFFRIFNVRLAMRGDTIFLQTVKKVSANADFSDESRKQKVKWLRILLLAASIASPFAVLATAGVSTVVFSINLNYSVTMYQKLVWFFWYLMDIGMGVAAIIDCIFVPAMWFVMTKDYEVDLQDLIVKLEDMARLQRGPASDGVARAAVGRYFYEVHLAYARLVAKAVAYNRFSAPILTAIVLTARPFFDTGLFVVSYAETSALTILLFCGGLITITFSQTLLYKATQMTAKVDVLHTRFCSVAANEVQTTRLAMWQRNLLSQMIQEIGSEKPLLAVYLTDGKKFTMNLLAEYQIETALQFTLLVTLEQYIS